MGRISKALAAGLAAAVGTTATTAVVIPDQLAASPISSLVIVGLNALLSLIAVYAAPKNKEF